MTFKEIKDLSGMKLTEFSKYFEIPYRTVQNWEAGSSKAPDYLLKLMKYKLENDRKQS